MTNSWSKTLSGSGPFRLFLAFAILMGARNVSAGVVLKLGDILVIEPGSAVVAVIDPATGVRTEITSGGFLLPSHKSVGVALDRDGDIIVVHRLQGIIRVNPVSGSQTVLSQGGFFKDP